MNKGYRLEFNFGIFPTVFGWFFLCAILVASIAGGYGYLSAIHVVSWHLGVILFWYLFFLREKGYFAQKHNISSVNTTFNKSAVDALPTYLPSKDEQDKIAATLDIIDSKIDLLKKKRNIQEELFRTLLHQLMTGQTRVNEIDFKTK